MNLTDRVAAATKEYQTSLDSETKRKMDNYRQFRQRMIDAGIEVDDQYQIPLMQRIGHGHARVMNKRPKPK